MYHICLCSCWYFQKKLYYFSHVDSDGKVIDPDSGLVGRAHVYSVNRLVYSVNLINVDLPAGKNSYYKIQLLESDADEKSYWLFRAWGRISTNIGNSRTESFSDLELARKKFQQLYGKLTGNYMGEEFEKKRGKYYLEDIDYDEDVKSAKNNCTVASTLPKSTQSLVELLFDKYTINHMILEFYLDIEKKPLGKLSKKQLNKALALLGRVAEMIKSGSSPSAFIATSNEFYALIPHNFGHNHPPVIDKIEMIHKKVEMIECLRKMKLTFKFLNDVNGQGMHPTDFNYQHLKTKIEPLDHNSKEFEQLIKYVKNGDDKTDNFELEVEDIFKVARDGEDTRYRPFMKRGNKKLLWHGSRLTNFVSILSEGLKIAPSGIPTAGDMFGKGIYFADMLHKSAQYCYAEETNNTGLALLCQVALGNSQECYERDDRIKLREGFHSVKGVGETQPNPDQKHTREDGVEIPFGEQKKQENITSSLHRNEYVIYDAAQAKIEYLVKLKFIKKD